MGQGSRGVHFPFMYGLLLSIHMRIETIRMDKDGKINALNMTDLESNLLNETTMKWKK